MLMNDKLNEYLNFMAVEKNRSKNTLRGYRTDIEQFANMRGVSSIDQITKQEIRAYIAELADNGAEPASRNRKLTALRSFCNYLNEEGYISGNPAASVQYAKIDKRLPEVMTVDETFSAIDSAAGNPRDKAILETFYGTGARVDEVARLKVTDINFEDQLVRLFGKGSKQRVVPMSSAAIESIKTYLEIRDNKSEFVFDSPVNPSTHLSTRAIYDIAVKYAGVSPHKFRHSVATHLLANDMDIREIQEFLGHENINTTTIYTQVSVQKMAKGFHRAHPRG